MVNAHTESVDASGDARTKVLFDPKDNGTSEAAWRSLLSPCDTWMPRAGPLVVVSPHPDDEVLGAGGLMYEWAARGHCVTVVSVTDGEAAYPRMPALAATRRGELKAALRKLSSRPISVVRLGIPDGRVDCYRNTVRNFVLSLLSAPVTLVVPFEHDGHPDHEAVGDVCREVALAHAIASVRYPIWAWHHGDPHSFANAHWGKFPLRAEAQTAKARAVRCFRSQLCPRQVEPIIPRHVLTYFERPYEAFLL